MRTTDDGRWTTDIRRLSSIVHRPPLVIYFIAAVNKMRYSVAKKENPLVVTALAVLEPLL
jgi:hypothetical protein